MAATTLYHITSKTAWEEAKERGSYTADSLKQIGFIHLSTAVQYPKSASRFYKGQTGLVLLEVDVSKLKHELKYEHVHAGEDPFPHLFGELNLDAVVLVHKFEQIGGPDGETWKVD